MESLLERAEGRSTLQNFFDDNDRFVRLFLLSANQNFSLSFVYRMLKFVSRTLETCKCYYVVLLHAVKFVLFTLLSSLIFVGVFLQMRSNQAI
jgi:hypothetical protein